MFGLEHIKNIRSSPLTVKNRKMMP
jgi:hypothetical protein